MKRVILALILAGLLLTGCKGSTPAPDEAVSPEQEVEQEAEQEVIQAKEQTAENEYENLAAPFKSVHSGAEVDAGAAARCYSRSPCCACRCARAA